MAESITVTMSREELDLLLDTLRAGLDCEERSLSRREMLDREAHEDADFRQRYREFEELGELESRLRALSLAEPSTIAGPHQPEGADGDMLF
jgi:hypothetical protein